MGYNYQDYFTAIAGTAFIVIVLLIILGGI